VVPGGRRIEERDAVMKHRKECQEEVFTPEVKCRVWKTVLSLGADPALLRGGEVRKRPSVKKKSKGLYV